MIIMTVEKFEQIFGISRMTQSKALKAKRVSLQKELVGNRWRLVYSTEAQVEAVFAYMGLKRIEIDGAEYLVKLVRKIKKPAG